MPDPRAERAREAHHLAASTNRLATLFRDVRNQAIRGLRDEGWTYGEIARVVGCSPELVAAIVKGRTGQNRT